MNLSYWEYSNWFDAVEYTVVGSGITGLHAALRLRERFPRARILILEKGALPEGASTKNAGFACFGSLSEILDDLKKHSPQEVTSLIAKRVAGLKLLRERLGDASIGFEPFGGYELFENAQLADICFEKMAEVNQMLQPIFGQDVFTRVKNGFMFQNIAQELVFNPFEAQINTGQMMQSLLRAAHAKNILILNKQQVISHQDLKTGVEVHLDNFSFKTQKLLFATNGFASALTNEEVVPARAQVLITEPIAGLPFKGTFHLDEGYYYFRNVGERVLFGGGRNLDFDSETTTDFSQTALIQERLEQLLRDVILPGRDFTVSHRWSGIMGMGAQKKPIVKQLSDNVFCGVRLGGMGVAIGSLVGKELADLI
jgi:glycine/D-amino acid oxidase-like deaminating enzyme